jgi:mRNA interferase YafQ
MREVKPTSKFKKDLKVIEKRGYDISLMKDIVLKLANGVKLEPRHKDHAMSGKWLGFRNCHITPDWVLLYKLENKVLILVLARTGTHSDLAI